MAVTLGDNSPEIIGQLLSDLLFNMGIKRGRMNTPLLEAQQTMQRIQEIEANSWGFQEANLVS